MCKSGIHKQLCATQMWGWKWELQNSKKPGPLRQNVQPLLIPTGSVAPSRGHWEALNICRHRDR